MTQIRKTGTARAMFLCLFLSASLPTGLAAASGLGSGVFPDAARVEAELVRGKSTRADVRTLLGIPSGAGGALMPGVDGEAGGVEPYDVWYYEDIEAGNIRSEEGTLVMDMRQQILVIFFKGDFFHGYFWTSNAFSPEVD